MGEPVGLSAITAGITTVIKIFEVTYQLKAVGEQTTDLLDTTQHVELNIREARRLRRLKDSLLNAGERTWMDKVIEDTEKAVRTVAQLIEPSRVGMQTKQGIDLGHRAVWVFRESPKVRDKFARLSVCHQTFEYGRCVPVQPRRYRRCAGRRRQSEGSTASVRSADGRVIRLAKE